MDDELNEGHSVTSGGFSFGEIESYGEDVGIKSFLAADIGQRIERLGGERIARPLAIGVDRPAESGHRLEDEAGTGDGHAPGLPARHHYGAGAVSALATPSAPM